MSEHKYPEHEKLQAVTNESQRLGEFLDMGLPSLKLTLYEERFFDCDCDWCEGGEGEAKPSHEHDAKRGELRFKDGKAQYPRMVPTHRKINEILAEYFGIDQAKLDAEKDQMYKDMQAKAEAG